MVFSSSLCSAWTEKSLTKPETLEVFVCLALVSCWAPAQRLLFPLRVPPRSIRNTQVLPQGWALSFTLSFGVHWSRQKASLWLQVDKYWALQPHFGKCWAPWFPAKSMRAAGGVETQATNNFQHTTICPSLLSVPILVFLFHSYPV